MSFANQRTCVMYILSIFYTAIVFALQMASVGMFLEHYTVSNIHCLKVAGTMIMTLYLFELTYRSVMRFQMLTHHFCTIFAVIFVIACMGATDDPSLFVTALCWGFQASTEQVQFAGLLMYRFKCSPRAVSSTLRFGAAQALIAKMCSSVYVFIWWGQNQARHTHPTEIAFSVILVLAMSCLMVTQFYGSYVVWILSNSYEKKYFAGGAVRLGDRDGAKTPGSMESFTMPVPRLRADVIYNIVDMVSETYNHPFGFEPSEAVNESAMRAQLLACCRAGKDFLPRARFHLYKEVSVAFEDRGDYGIGQTECSAAQVASITLNPHLGNLVRRIVVDVKEVPIQKHMVADALADALAAAPNVREISMLVPDEDTGGEQDLIRYLPPVYKIIESLGSSLRGLEIRWHCSEPGREDLARYRGVFPLLASLPSLEHLSLKNLHVPQFSSSLPTFLFQLKSLTLTGIHGPGSNAMFTSLATNSSRTLDTLRLPQSIKCDPSQLEALKSLAFLSEIHPRDMWSEVEPKAAIRNNVGPTIATAPSCVQNLEINDCFGSIPLEALDGEFFATTVPRSISTITLIGLAVDAEAVSRLLDGRPEALPGSQVQPQRFYKLVTVKNHLVVEGVVRGDTATLISRLREAAVVFQGLD
ncbi:hypothetical protein RQP46_001434 [Phenoliferia psychrophenolica]